MNDYMKKHKNAAAMPKFLGLRTPIMLIAETEPHLDACHVPRLANFKPSTRVKSLLLRLLPRQGSCDMEH